MATDGGLAARWRARFVDLPTSLLKDSLDHAKEVGRELWLPMDTVTLDVAYLTRVRYRSGSRQIEDLREFFVRKIRLGPQASNP